MSSFPSILLSLLLLTYPVVALTRAEESALGETEGLLGEHDPPDPRTEALARRVLLAGERFTANPGAMEGDPTEAALFPDPRTQYFRFDGSVDWGMNGLVRLRHALELGHFAYALAGEYGGRDRRTRMRESGSGRLSAGWMDPRGHRLLLRSDYTWWGFASGAGYQEQDAWRTSLLGVWRPSDEITTFAQAGFGTLEQWGPAEFRVLDADATLGARLFLGADDFLAADLTYNYSDAARFRHQGRLYLSNTFTADRILFISTGAGLAFEEGPILEFGGAVRLLFGPLSLVSLVARREALLPDPAEEWRQIEGLSAPGVVRTRISEDIYLEYSLHISESSVAGLRGGYRKVANPWEYSLGGVGELCFDHGPDRELLVFSAYCDYLIPEDICRGRLRLDYELADATPPWGPAEAVPPPHFAEHRLDVDLEVAPLDWLTGSVELEYLSRRLDGLGGELPGAANLGLRIGFRFSEVATLTLTGTNLLNQPLFTYAEAPRDPAALGLELSLSW